VGSNRITVVHRRKGDWGSICLHFVFVFDGMCEQLSDSIKGAEYAYKERGSTGYEYECIIIIL